MDNTEFPRITMGVYTLPNNFIPKIFRSEYFIYQTSQMMALVRIAV